MVRDIENCRIAWLFPSLQGASYWHPVLSEFNKIFSQTVVYTGAWPGFASGFENSFHVEVVGKVKFIEVSASKSYVPNFTYASPKIIISLFQFAPDIIYTSSFSLWTLLALLLKFLGKWKVVIAYDGSSPTYDYCNSPFRLFFRRIMSRLSDTFITNSQAGKVYLTEVLGVNERQVFARPYEVPDPEAMKVSNSADQNILKYQKPIFLFVGQIIYRKGLHYLLEACALLKERGVSDYTLLALGAGSQQQEFQALSKSLGLEECIQWIGQVNYEYLSAYFSNSDVFIFPTLEDTWGMVVLEAMALGKAVLCSKWAGSAEMVVSGENGYIFDPYEPEKLASLMSRFIEDRNLSRQMGKNSKDKMATHNPNTVSKFLADVVEFTIQE